MYDSKLHPEILALVKKLKQDKDLAFMTRLMANAVAIRVLYDEIYGNHPQAPAEFDHLMEVVVNAAASRPEFLQKKDAKKNAQQPWFLSNEMAGMSLYVDRFCGNLQGLPDKLPYLKKLGINLLHLMPLFQSPPLESDGGYAVSDFRKVDPRFGTMDDLKSVIKALNASDMHLMLDIVLNHTSHEHDWAKKAREGDEKYSEYYYFYPDRTIPDQFEQTMPDVFPEAAPGSFTYVEERQEWVMTVFHRYQWDLNYTNPAVLCAMLEHIFYYANLGVDVLRIDAPAFIWKQLGTTSQNLPQAHTLLRLIKLCVEAATPGMALLGEAIVAPKEIMKYFGEGVFTAKECDFAYNATLMALQWDALATADTRVLLGSQPDLMQKPLGTSWITYTRCHDDIGLGYEDDVIRKAGFAPYDHRKFIKDFYSGEIDYSPATGALFAVNPKTQDARISGTLASLCGLEKALANKDQHAIEAAIHRILLMQAVSIWSGGMPMLFYGDEAGYTNDYSFENDPGKSYDNRWMHRPVIDWNKNRLAEKKDTVESQIFNGTKRLIELRKKMKAFADEKNTVWRSVGNLHVACLERWKEEQHLICLFNFSSNATTVHSSFFSEKDAYYNHWTEKRIEQGRGFLVLAPYEFVLLEGIQ
jgi:amylosucrase